MSALPIHPLDTGPIYRETFMGQLPVEPWNTFSNIVFLAIVIYWSWKVYPRARQHLFLAFALPVLFIGFIGGTLYHALRDYEIWLWMDWLPIVLLCLSCTVLFARRAGLPWSRLALLLALPFGLRVLMTEWMDWSNTVILNVEYAVIGAAVLAPLLLHLYTRNWRNKHLVIFGVASFGVALMFRSLDHHPLMAWLPMGSHWLWHVLGGLAVHFILGYIYQDDLQEVKTSIPARAPQAHRAGSKQISLS